MTLKVFHSRRIWYKVIYEKMGISASWSVSWRCQYYQQASSLLVGCSIGLVLLQQMLYHQESWYSSQVDVVCLYPFVWYPALWPVVSAVLRDIAEQAHGGLWRWEVGSYTEYVVLPVANDVSCLNERVFIKTMSHLLTNCSQSTLLAMVCRLSLLVLNTR